MSERDVKTVDPIAADALLRDATEAEILALEDRFASFPSQIIARLDEAMAPEPERVLRVAEATADERADAVMFDDETFELVGPALRASMDAELEHRDREWPAFAQAIEDGIDAEAAAHAVGAALRAEVDAELSARAPEWSAFAQQIEDGIDGEAAAHAVGAALRAEVDAEISVREPEWAAFAQQIEDGLDAEAAAPQIAAALREEVDEAVAAREGQWSDFEVAVMARLPAETVTVAELLTAETNAELAARQGEWQAFTARVFEAVDAEERSFARESAEVQAVQQLKTEVEAEIDGLNPRFDRAFRRDVEKEIFRAGQQPDPWWVRSWAWIRTQLVPEHGPGFGWAAAGAAAVLLVVVTGLPPAETPKSGVAPLAGHVTIEQMSFEGDVTVLSDEGLTVVWLSDAPS